MKILMIKNMNQTLSCAYGSDLDKIKRIKSGEIIECVIRRKRNAKFLRKFFALIQLCYDNQEVYDNIDFLRRDLIVAAGFYEQWYDHNGEEQIRAKSISFAAMEEDEFSDLYDRVLDQVCDIFDFDKQVVSDNLSDFM